MTLTPAEFRAVLIQAIAEAGGNEQFAAKHGFHPVSVSAWKRGVEPCGPKVAKALGFERVYAYRKIA